MALNMASMSAGGFGAGSAIPTGGSGGSGSFASGLGGRRKKVPTKAPGSGPRAKHSTQGKTTYTGRHSQGNRPNVARITHTPPATRGATGNHGGRPNPGPRAQARMSLLTRGGVK